MTTQKNLVTMMLTGILTAGIFSFASCSDDYEENVLNQNAQSALDDQQKFTGDGDILAGSRYTIMPFQVNANGAWTLERDCKFFNVMPKSGEGPTEVKIYFQDNDGEARRVGHMTINSEGKSTSLTLVQKTQEEDEATRADKLETSNCIYAIGYGYNTMDRWAHPSSVKCEIFDTHMLADRKLESMNTVDLKLRATTVTGSSMNELTDNLSSKANVKGGFGKFKAEASANFDANYAKKNTYEYAITYMDATVRTVRFETNIDVLKKEFITQAAYDAINGRTQRYQGAEGLKHLVEDYGTHVAITANLGGRICYSMALDVTNVEGSYDLKAFAKASYGGIAVSGGGEVSNDMKSAYQRNASKCEMNLSVQGGDESKAKALAAKGGFNDNNVQAWLQSVSNNELSLMGFDQGALVPLYELVDDNNEARRNELKAYFDGKNGQICSDFDCMIQSTITKVNLPQFNANGTLVKDIMLGGQKVGIICNEYVPQINMQQRINVVYPVINGKPRLNLGYFLGDKDHKPGRCSWDGTGITYEAAEELPYGETKTLYLSGASVSAKLAYGDTSRDGSVCDAFMVGLTKKDDKNVSHNYPIVKIANNIWTRENYGAFADGGYHYYSIDKLSYIKIGGWKIPKATDYKDMKNWLVKYDTPMPALKMFNDNNMMAQDLTGFQLRFNGAWYASDKKYVDQKGLFWAQIHEIAGNRNTYDVVEIEKNGEMNGTNYNVVYAKSYDWSTKFCLRMVKEL